MQLRKFLEDIVTYVSPITDEVLLTPEENGIKIECMNDTRTIVLKAKSKESIPEFSSAIGLKNLNLLKGLIRHPVFLNTEIELISENEKGKKNKIPTELHFHSENGKVNAVYRFMHPDIITNQPKFKEPKWDIILEVDENKFDDFSSFAAIFPSVEKRFSAITRENDLIFSIGGKNTNLLHGVEYSFATVNIEFDEPLYWPLVEFLSTMKLCFSGNKNKNKKVIIKIVQIGAMEIYHESETTNWSFILPAKKS